MKYFTLLVTGFIFLMNSSIAQIYSLDDFEEVAIPAPYSKLWYEWNNNVYGSFEVSITNGNLKISKEVNRRESAKLKVAGGMLIGEDHGEFGGGLFYEPVDRSIKHILVNGKLSTPKENAFVQGLVFVGKSKTDRAKLIPVKPGNIKDVFEYKSKLYTVEGLAHMSFSYGSFTDIEVKKNEVNYKEVLKLDDAPMAYSVYDGSIYLATYQRFYIVNDWKPKLIADKLFWQSLYPNSVAVKDEKHIYLGMRAGYAMVDAESGKITFYQYKEHK